MLRTLHTAGFILLLSACQAGLTPQPGDQQNPALSITSVTLNQDFTVRADFAGEYIQGGFITPYNSLAQYYTFCKLELRKPAPTGRIILPGTFTVSRIYQEEEIVGFVKQMYAGDGGSGLVMSRTVLFLKSAGQPEIFRLSCMKQDFSFYATQPSIEEMQVALGDMLTLNRQANDQNLSPLPEGEGL